MTERTFWHSWDLGIHGDKPLALALLQYRQKKNRVQVRSSKDANLVSSITDDGQQLPILDLDFAHDYYESIHPPRAYLNLTDSLTYAQERAVQLAFFKAGLLAKVRFYGSLPLDIPHHYVPSTNPGHGHLYIDQPISTWKWRLLMVRLYRAGLLEMGYVVWSLRRGGNFVRTEGTAKRRDGNEDSVFTYGWFRKLKEKK